MCSDLKRALSTAESWLPEPKRRRELLDSDVAVETVARIVKTIDEPKKMLGPDVRHLDATFAYMLKMPWIERMFIIMSSVFVYYILGSF